MSVEHIDDRDALKKIVASQAFHNKDNDETTVHCFMGMMGADWDLDAVFAEIDKAEKIGWVTSNIFDHQLAILSDGRIKNFDIKKPE